MPQCLTTEKTSILHFIAWSLDIPTELGIIFFSLPPGYLGLGVEPGAFQLGSGTQRHLQTAEFSEFLLFLFHRHTLAAVEIPGK